MRPAIYLAGYLRKDCPDDIAWRELAELHFSGADVEVLNPVRGHEHKVGEPGEFYEANELFHRDRHDIQRADIILFNCLPARPGDRAMLGTWVELGMASEMSPQKLIAVVSDDPNIVNHQFVRAIATRTFERLNDALDFISAYWL